MIPVIGISAEVDNEKDIKLKNTYVHAIEASGGLPMVLPYTEDEKTVELFAELCDGFLFTGGNDVSPARYGEKQKDVCGQIQYFRDAYEFNLFRHVMKVTKPVLAICRGAQLVNVALGGTLYQDIPSEKPSDITHRQGDFGSSPIHSVKLVANTPLSLLIDQEKMQVNSLHHQAIKTLGKGLEIMAVAGDGIVEAVYMPRGQYFQAYQWHPERMFDTDAQSRLIFEEFINACNA